MSTLQSNAPAARPHPVLEIEDAPPARHGQAARWPRTRGRWSYVVVAVASYLPMLLTKPGVVSNDTKTYLYLDPGTWIRTSASVWDPNVALGSVTHETIGYLFPMGPYYWALAFAHVPTWVAQRLWLGSIVFAAAAGVLFLADTLSLQGSGRLLAALAYGFTPYVLQYSGRISVILMPFAGLPWMVALVIRSLRTGGWRHPALFALVVATVSGINASSVIYVGIAPVLWLPFGVWVAGEATGRRAVGVFLRTGLLSTLACLWWIVGLGVEGAFGINVLRYTESVQATSSTSNAAEVLRGLGYWYFYGGDRMGLWTQAAFDVTQKLWLITLTYVLPGVALVSAAVCRWRYRAFFVALVVVGMVLSVGAYPFEHPTAFGALAKAFMTKTTAGLALRSTDRATPLIVLGLAMLMGMGLSALVARARTVGLAVFGVLAACVLVADAPFFAGATVIAQFSQPASPPSFVKQAAAHLNATHPGTRVYALPGNNFAAERWGDTIDPVWPALLTRPFVTREQQIQGSLPTADLLYALDAPLQQGTMDWSALAPVARLMSVGDVLVDYDQQYERYDPPRPAVLQHDLATTPAGLSDPVGFGPHVPNRSAIPTLDETYFGLPAGVAPPPPIVTYTVDHPRPVVRGESLARPLVVDGDAVGIVEAADAGLLATDPTILYAGTLDGDKRLATSVLSGPADLVVTDSARRQSFEWNSLNDNTGYTETAGERPNAFVQNDPGIDLFPGAGAGSQTTSLLNGIASVTASSYGTATALRSEWRPANAIDGNPTTAWETEGISGVPNGAWWQVSLLHATDTGSITLHQPQPVANEADYTNQWITRATLTFDGKDPVTVDLGPLSRTGAGQVVTFPRRSFTTLRIRIDSTNLSTGTSVPPGSSLVGLSEVGIGTAVVHQVIAVPTDLLRRAGPAAATDRLAFVFTRDRVAPVPPRQDPELAMSRQFSLPAGRHFTLAGTGRLSTSAPDPLVDQLVGRQGGGSPVVAASSSSRMPGDLRATASATLDGDPATAWSPGIGIGADQNSWLDYSFAAPRSVGSLDLQLVTDAEHSVPSSITVTGADGSRVVPLPPVRTTSPAGSTTSVDVHFPPVTGTHLQIAFTGIRVRNTASYETSLTDALPIAVAEVGIPGVSGPSLPATLPASCRSDLLRLDGRPLWVSVSGTTTAALGSQGLPLSLCGPDRNGITLSAGTHLLTAADGATSGLDVDQLVMTSAAVPNGSNAAVAAGPTLTAATSPSPARTTSAARTTAAPAVPPTVTVTAQNATRMSAHVEHATGPFLLVLGQSVNRGWAATVPGVGSLGPPTLVDGFANGWYLSAADLARAGSTGSFDVTFRFTPQSAVNLALLVSGAALVVCVAIVAVVLFRRRQRRRGAADGADTAAAERRTDTVAAADRGTALRPAAGPPSGERWWGGPGFHRSRPAATVAGVVLAGGSAWALAGPFAGIVTAVGVAVAMTVAWGRPALRIAAIVLMAGGAADVVLHQERYRYPPGGWPTQFDRASTLIWGAVMLVGADVVLESVRRWRVVRRLRAQDR